MRIRKLDICTMSVTLYKLAYFNTDGGHAEPIRIALGTLDHIPADIVQELAPGLVEHEKRMAEALGVVACFSFRANTGHD